MVRQCRAQSSQRRLFTSAHEPAPLVSLHSYAAIHCSYSLPQARFDDPAWTTSKFHGSRGEVPARERQRAGGEGLGAGGRRELNPKSANKSNNPEEAVEQDAAVRSAILTVKVFHSAGLAVFKHGVQLVMMLAETCNSTCYGMYSCCFILASQH